MQTGSSPHLSPTSPTLSNSPQSVHSDNYTLNTSNQASNQSPTHSAHSSAPPNSPIRPRPPLDSIFTTGDSDDNDERSGDSSEGEDQSTPPGEVKFSSYQRAHKKQAKKKLIFNEVTGKPSRKPAKPKKEDGVSVHSETQRMIRQSKIRIPEYEPPVIRLQDIIRKLPKLGPAVKPEIFDTVVTLPVPISAQTTSTPLPKSGLAQLECRDELPDIDFISEQPIGRLELTNVVSTNQPVLSLPNDFTNLNLATVNDAPIQSSLEAFKSRFVQHSLPPAKHHAPILSADAAESESLLPPEVLSSLSKKPGGVHAFLREKLRKNLIAKRVQEHEHLQIRLKYENEEYFPSEGSCSETEDVERAEEVKLIDLGEGDDNPETGDEVNNNNNNNSSSSDSDSETSDSEDSDTDSSDSEGEGEEDIKIPNLKAKRLILNESENESDDVGDESAANLDIKNSQSIQLDSPTKLPSKDLIHSPSLFQSLSSQERGENEPENGSDINSYFSTIPLSMECHTTDAQESFKLPSAYQMPSQSHIPEDLMRICDATQEGESELPLICSGVFTTQCDDVKGDDDVSVINTDTLQLDDTIDPDLPMLAPRKMKLKDELRLKRYRQLAAFEEREAELSGSDPEFEGSDCASEFCDELNEYESEEGDMDAVESEEVERLNAKYYNRVMIEDDEANMELLKDRFLPEQEIVEDGLRLKNGLFRKRKFNFEDDDVSDSNACDWDYEARDQDVDQVTQERRRRRVERDEYIARKSTSSLSELAYGDVRTIPLVDKPNVIRTISCEVRTDQLNIPSIRKSLGKHSSLLSRNFASKPDTNFISDSNSDSNLVGRKSYVFQTIRSLEAGNSNSVPPLSKSVSLPPQGSTGIKKANQFIKKIKPQSEVKKEVSFLKPGSSVFHLLNVN